MIGVTAAWILGAAVLASPPTGSCGVAAADATGRAFDFRDVVRSIDDSHPRLRAAAARVEAAAADAVAAGLWTNPTLSTQWDRSIGFTTYNPRWGYFQLQAMQWIEVGAPRARRRAGRWEAVATRRDREDVRRGLVRDAYVATVALARTQHRRDILAQARRQLLDAKRIVARRVAAGAAPDVHLVRLDVMEAELDAAEREGLADLGRARRDLELAVGPGAAQLAPRTRLDLCQTTDLPELETLRHAFASRPDLAALRTREKAAQASVTAARRAVFRGVGLTVGTAIGGGYDPATGRQQVDVIGGVALPLPLVDRGQGSVRAVRARASAAQRDTEAAHARAELDVARLLEEARTRRQARDQLAQAGVRRAEVLVSEVMAGYRDGGLGVLELVDALETLREVRLQLADLAAAARLTEGEVLDAAGMLGTP